MEQLYFWLAGSNFALSNPEDGSYEDKMKLYRNNFASAYPHPFLQLSKRIGPVQTLLSGTQETRGRIA